ncbi:2Fe-2S iron-sulfur cluster binding domain-containing protein [Pelistega sp. NLN82]|uniref:2Fe-2S iron-sulfur cluster binding domain-containing protein n=1 Tax=Pelistega ratti TaxID=2652177 RepID=A0A6L9Y6M6_9BURK|nr:2Fe-2S iron-sulfur cluster binding domain-containing protein [Pelistega ratti]NEN76003.1 2Fe-2S iron-sulfur cluster binding domain-containing protein [Pelistega ratti]
MLHHQLRWIPAHIREVSFCEEGGRELRLFLPSFTRFMGLSSTGVFIDVKTPSGFVCHYPIISVNEAQHEVVIQISSSDDSEGTKSMFKIFEPDELIEITSPFNEEVRSDDIDFYVKLARTGVTIAIPEGMSISDTLREHNIKVNTSCEYGVCGTCYTTVLSGEILHQDTYLMEDEKQAQDCMMICVSRGKPGTTIELDI